MLGAFQVVDIVRIVFFVPTILLAFIYSIAILFNKRFHNPLNILTVNLAISCIICAIYWAIYYILHVVLLDDLNNWNCVLFQYFQTIVNFQEIYALCNVSINRFCIILYNNKLLFKTQRWVFICIGVQWLMGFILLLPLISLNGQTCGQLNQALWLRIYTLLIILIIPIILFLIINSTILYYAHSSRKRIAPLNPTLLVNNRDIRLVKRMLIIFLLFLLGWGPVYILYSIENSYSIPVELVKLLPELSILGEVINLFLYNREVLKYSKDKCFHCINFI